MTIYTRFDEETTFIKVRKLEKLKNHYKIMADVLSSNEVQALLKKWSGKKYTKRLETALKDIDSRFYVNTRFGKHLEFNFFNDRSFYHQESERCIYIPSYEHTIGNLTQSCFGEGENIIAKNIEEIILNSAKYYQTQYQKLDNQLFQLQEYIKEFQYIVNKYNDFEEKVDADIRAEFNMNLQMR